MMKRLRGRLVSSASRVGALWLRRCASVGATGAGGGPSVAGHVPVLLNETVESLRGLRDPVVVVDGTVGAGGHARAVLERYPSVTRYIGIDRDPNALALAAEALQPFQERTRLVRGCASDMASILESEGVSLGGVCAALLDVGVSSMQLDDVRRGFSFRFDGPLDMRMDPSATLTAEKIVNDWSETDLGALFRELGEERRWKRLARAVCDARINGRIETTGALARVIEAASGGPKWRRTNRIHPATLCFQAIRIHVNDELQELSSAIPGILPFLAPGGRLSVISFHSLEDRIVKYMFRDELTAKVITKRPVRANAAEIQANPRARSAKLRTLQILTEGEERPTGRKRNKYAQDRVEEARTA